MKKMIIALVCLSNVAALAASPQRIICRDDQRMNNGPLREIILSTDQDGYFAQSSYVASLDAPDIQIERWAEKLSCHIDEKFVLAYCDNSTGKSIQIKDRREVFYDASSSDAKKKANKFIDISVQQDGAQNKVLSFAASHCQLFGGET